MHRARIAPGALRARGARSGHAAAVALGFAAVLGAVVAPTTIRAVGQEFIPLDHWAYRAVERFEALGLCRLPGDRPWTRTEFADLVARLARRAWDERLASRDRYELARLEKEFTTFAGRRDPQARYDPPTLYLPDAPLLFTADFDLEGSAERNPMTERIDPLLRSHPEARVHFGERATLEVRYRLELGPARGERARGAKPSRRERSWKGLTSLFERGYLIGAWSHVHAFVGRAAVDWGPSDGGNLVTPGPRLTLDQFGARIRIGPLRLSAFDAQLWPAPQRRLAGHRLEVAFGSAVLGFTETVLYAGRGMDPVYAVPLASFYANQFNERGDDNVVWAIDGKVRVARGLVTWASLLVDDAQFERDGTAPDKLAADVGGRAAIGSPLAMTLRARYRFVDIYTFTHRDSATVYVSGRGRVDEGDALLSTAPSPDSDDWFVELEAFPAPRLVLTARLAATRRGEGDDLRRHRPGDPIDPPFPSGVVERLVRGGVRLRWEFDRNQWIEAGWSWRRHANRFHDPADDRSGHAVHLAARFEFL